MHIELANLESRNKRNIARSFNKAAPYYDKYASFQRNCGKQLLVLLEKVKGKYILDAGCGTGWFSKILKHEKKYVISLDLSPIMLIYAKKRKSSNVYLAGDIENLPIATSSIDLIFSNLVAQWCNDLSIVLQECYRVLRPGGMLAISTLAQGSMLELALAWEKVDEKNHVNRFLSQSSIYSAFSIYNHKLYSEVKTLYYSKLLDLLKEIKGVGASYVQNSKQLGLTSRNKFQKLEKYWIKCADKFPISYNIIYGIIYRD